MSCATSGSEGWILPFSLQDDHVLILAGVCELYALLQHQYRRRGQPHEGPVRRAPGSRPWLQRVHATWEESRSGGSRGSTGCWSGKGMTDSTKDSTHPWISLV